MKISPTYIFDTINEVGINKVPVDALIVIKDADGNGNSLDVIKIAPGELNNNSTVNDFLSDTLLFKQRIKSVTSIAKDGTESLGNIVRSTKVNYDNITNKDPDTIYVLKG